MKQQFLNMVESLRAATTGLSKMPNYITLLALAKHPKALYRNPAEVASLIQINVNDDFVNDPELFVPTVDAYVEMLNCIYKQLLADFPYGEHGETARNIFMNMVKTMTLTYTF